MERSMTSGPEGLHHGAHRTSRAAAAEGHSHTGHEAASPRRMALSATLHCLTGCAIGEILGLVIGTAGGLPNTATISLSIALLNLLPFLPLDGGHIAFAIAEGIRGRVVRREIYERVSIVGIVLVVLLFFVGLSNDIDRLS